jgi:hypothetical protein
VEAVDIKSESGAYGLGLPKVVECRGVGSTLCGCTALNERSLGGYAEDFEQAGLHLLGERVDLIDAESRRAYAIPQLSLARGCFHNLQNSVGDFLGISCSLPETLVDLYG